MDKKEFKIGIVGGTSLLAGYLIKILVHHPGVRLDYLSSEHNEKAPVSSYHKVFHDKLKDKIFDPYSPEYIRKNLDLVFVAKPHSQSMEKVKELYDGHLKIIDLSGDFRLKDVSEYEKWYKAGHTAPELAKKSVYGLTELYPGEIKKAMLVANPGCYPTGILLGLYPVFKAGIIDADSISIDSYSGVSGAGKNPVPGKNLFLDVFNNIIAYKINDHQHTPEIEEQLSLFQGKKICVNFIPHLASMNNGIFNTMFMKLKKRTEGREIIKIYQDIYSQSRFVRVFPDEPAQIKDVVDTNLCIITPRLNERTNTLIVMSAIDNRIKGGAGQAVQNMNLMLGFPDDTGITI